MEPPKQQEPQQPQEEPQESDNLLRKQQEEVAAKRRKFAMIGALGAVATLALFLSLCGTGTLILTQTKPEKLATMGDRIAFVCKYAAWHCLWFMVMVTNVSVGRFKDKAFDPTDSK